MERDEKITKAEDFIKLVDEGYKGRVTFEKIVDALVSSDMSNEEWDKLNVSGYDSLILNDPRFCEVHPDPLPWEKNQ